MAQFIPAIDLWNAKHVAMVEAGEIELQRGQWVFCGPGTKSRFISYNAKSKTFDVVHGADEAEVNRKFNARLEAIKVAEKRFAENRAKRLAAMH